MRLCSALSANSLYMSIQLIDGECIYQALKVFTYIHINYGVINGVSYRKHIKKDAVRRMGSPTTTLPLTLMVGCPPAVYIGDHVSILAKLQSIRHLMELGIARRSMHAVHCITSSTPVNSPCYTVEQHSLW